MNLKQLETKVLLLQEKVDFLSRCEEQQRLLNVRIVELLETTTDNVTVLIEYITSRPDFKKFNKKNGKSKGN
jgi:hypothetical protein